jgi:hypothetical protein
VRAFISLVIVGIGAFNQFENAKRAKAVDVSIDAASTSARIAEAKADAAIRGRRLSQEQKDKIRAGLSGVSFSDIRVQISFVSEASEGMSVAFDFSSLLTSVGIACDAPREMKPESWETAPSGICICLAGDAPSSANKLARVLKAEIAEAHMEGISSACAFQTEIFTMRIVVGHKT